MLIRIYGTCGEYSDQCEWTVGVTRSMDRALKLIEEYNQWLIENGVHVSCDETDYDCKECPFDPFFQTSYTGSIYHWEEIADLDVSSGDGLI